MADKEKNDNETEFYEAIMQTADFVHDRLANIEEPTGLNYNPEEYLKDDEGKA